MNKIRITVAVLFCAVAALVSNSCTKTVGRIPTVSGCDTVTYTKHIKPIIDSTCISCHGTVPQAGAPPLTNYNEVVNNAALIKSTVFDGVPTPMPQTGSLTDAQKAALQCWLNNGNKQ